MLLVWEHNSNWYIPVAGAERALLLAVKTHNKTPVFIRIDGCYKTSLAWSQATVPQ